MICPCCLGPLDPAAELPRLQEVALTTDRYCQECRWFFANEILQPECDPMALDGLLRCPTHRLNPAHPYGLWH